MRKDIYIHIYINKYQTALECVRNAIQAYDICENTNFERYFDTQQYCPFSFIKIK